MNELIETVSKAPDRPAANTAEYKNTYFEAAIARRLSRIPIRSRTSIFSGCLARKAPMVINANQAPPAEKATAKPATIGSSKNPQPPCSVGRAILFTLSGGRVTDDRVNDADTII